MTLRDWRTIRLALASYVGQIRDLGRPINDLAEEAYAVACRELFRAEDARDQAEREAA